MGRSYYIRQRRQGCVWPVITFFVLVGAVAQISTGAAIIVAAVIIGLGVVSLFLKAGNRREVERGW